MTFENLRDFKESPPHRLKSRTVECPVVNGDQFQYQGMITPRMAEILLDFVVESAGEKSFNWRRRRLGREKMRRLNSSFLQMARRDANEITPVVLLTAPWYEGYLIEIGD